MKESTRVLIALGAAVAGGIAIAASGSAALLRAADFIAPVGTLWVNAIRMTVIPLMVALLITSVASAAEVRSGRSIRFQQIFPPTHARGDGSRSTLRRARDSNPLH